MAKKNETNKKTEKPLETPPEPSEQTAPIEGKEVMPPPEAKAGGPTPPTGEAEEKTTPTETEDSQRKIDFTAGMNSGLYRRAKKIGFSDEQIANYNDAGALQVACDRIKPQATPQPKQRAPKLKIAPDKPKGKKARRKFTTEMNFERSKHVTRSTFDEMLQNSFIHRNRITNIQKVTIVRNYVPDKKGKLISVITIDYLK